MAKKKIIVKKSRTKEAPKKCFFCTEKKVPDFLEHEILAKFTSERGKILSRTKSGICSKHQRRLTTEIKRARHLAFLPFVVKPD